MTPDEKKALVEEARSRSVLMTPAEILSDLLDRLADALEAAQDWKAQAMRVLAEWDATYEAVGSPGRVGQSKAVALREEIERLRALSSHPDEETVSGHQRDRDGICSRCGQGLTALDIVDGERPCERPDEETVNTVEELDALPVGSLVLAGGEVYQRITPNPHVNSGRESWRCLNDATGYREWETYAPLVVMTQEFQGGHAVARVLVRPTPEGSETA